MSLFICPFIAQDWVSRNRISCNSHKLKVFAFVARHSFFGLRTVFMPNHCTVLQEKIISKRRLVFLFFQTLARAINFSFDLSFSKWAAEVVISLFDGKFKAILSAEKWIRENGKNIIHENLFLFLLNRNFFVIVYYFWNGINK